MKRMLDLFCGRFGWSRAFAARGWECVGVDLVYSPEHQPERSAFVRSDILEITAQWIRNCNFDFICASSPCEEFSVHGMKHFHPNPKYPENGIRLFNHTREICEASGVPYVMENVRAAQQFIGQAKHHCGPFYLWGNAVPPLLHRGITKGMGKYDVNGVKHARSMWESETERNKRGPATIPLELSACVADYAARLLETGHEQATGVSGRLTR